MVTEQVFRSDQALALESGETLPGFHLHYATWGTLNKTRSNIVWICHALTASADFSAWWPGMFGVNDCYDPKDWFVVCVNMLGGCYGSLGPLDIKQGTDKAWPHDFPRLTNPDIVKAFDRLRQHLKIEKAHTLIGGSMGGQQALEWILYRPEVFEHLVLLATNARHSPWGIAFNESQRMAMENDPTWKTNSPEAGKEGMKTARSIALLSYRTYDTYFRTQGDDNEGQIEGFRAASYQRYQGDKLAKRFNAYTYHLLSRAMDSHNIARGRGEIEDVLKGIKINTLIMGIDTDVLFPISEQKMLARWMPKGRFEVVHSLYGHDGFLLETKQITSHIKQFYSSHITRG